MAAADPHSPLVRAKAAAEQLAMEGNRVTAEAVRRRAGVGMSAALAASREWNSAQGASRAATARTSTVATAGAVSTEEPAEDEAIPPMPEALRRHLEGVADALWKESRRQARRDLVQAQRTHAGVRTQLESEIASLREKSERLALARESDEARHRDLVAQLREEIERSRSREAAAETEAQRLREENRELVAQAARAEGRAEALQARGSGS